MFKKTNLKEFGVPQKTKQIGRLKQSSSLSQALTSSGEDKNLFGILIISQGPMPFETTFSFPLIL